MFDIDEYFRQLRHNDRHHMGLGDIRLTIDQQEMISHKYNELLELFEAWEDYGRKVCTRQEGVYSEENWITDNDIEDCEDF